MKNIIETSKPIKNEDELTLKFGKSEILSLDSMKCICGGVGEADGGADIIMPFGSKK
jgi:hypothetical protein